MWGSNDYETSGGFSATQGGDAGTPGGDKKRARAQVGSIMHSFTRYEFFQNHVSLSDDLSK